MPAARQGFRRLAFQPCAIERDPKKREHACTALNHEVVQRSRGFRSGGELV